jgi:hypothetical protein
MAGLSFDVLRTGKRYRLINFGETHEFVVENVLSNGDFKVKDLLTLERYRLKELIHYGTGKDFMLEEIGHQELGTGNWEPAG